jgi:thioredoxin-related protein
MIRVLFISLLLPFSIYSQTETVWTNAKDWNEVKKMAKMQNKFIFVDVYATWCGPCRLMDKNVYGNDTVRKVLSKDFISIKVQMDSTTNDDAHTKSWYDDAHQINEKYKPEGLPALLFFSPQGELAYKEVGYVSPVKFVYVAKEALTNPLGRYEQSMSRFKEGKMDFAEMPALARLANLKKEKDLSINIAKTYKEKWLDLQPGEVAFTRENLLFIVDFYYYLINSKDRYFNLFYEKPAYADSIIHHSTFKNISNFIAWNIIIKEEISDKLYLNDKAITKPKPNWKKIYSSIAGKYSKVNLDDFFLDQQIKYYQVAGDWRSYIKYVERKMKKYPPRVGGKLFGPQFGDAGGINLYAWNMFLYCADKKLLKSALKWSDISIKLETRPGAITNFMDTKANLLYKMGRSKDAIELEEKVIERNPSSEGTKLFIGNLNKMKQGIPTWGVNK